MLQDEVTFAIIRYRIPLLIYDLRLLPKEGTGARTWLEGDRWRWRDHEHTRLRLPPGIHNWTFLFADDAVIPLPGLRVDWLSHGSQQPKGGKIMLVRPGLTKTH